MTEKTILRLSFVCLLLWTALGTALIHPTSADLPATLIMLVAKLVPLTVFLRAILKESGYGLLALTLVLLFYMGFSVMDCFHGGLQALVGGVALFLELLVSVLALRVVKRQPRGQGAL